MKTRGQIAQKLKQTKFRHIKREVRSLLRRSAPNCKNNRSLDLEIGPVGVCALDCEVCDARFGDRAPQCEKWDPRYDSGEVKESLRNFFQTRSVAEIAVRFPDVAALLWVLIEDGADDPQESVFFPGALLTDEFFGVELWVDHDEQLENLREASKPLLAAQETVQTLARELGAMPDTLLSKVRILQEDVSRSNSEVNDLLREREELEAKVSVMGEERQRRDDEIARLKSQVSTTEARPWWRSLWPF